MNHPVLTTVAAMHAALDEISGVDPMFMTVTEKKTALVAVARLRARIEALDLRLLAAGDLDIAEDTGARSTAVWVADETKDAHGAVRQRAALAKTLAERWTQVGDALAAGVVNLAQTRAIIDSLDALPDQVSQAVAEKAETFLLTHAADLGPRELRHLGRGVLAHLAPDLADQAELRRLQAEEARAETATRVTFRPRGDGTTDIYATVADHVAGRLRAITDAVANPHRPGNDDDFIRLPVQRRRGIALQSLLETIVDSDLPKHGATATSVVVTVAYETLVTGLGTATTSTGQTLTAEQARRLACTAQILPAVLGTNSEILDLGRSSRFFKGGARKAMDLRDKHCTTRGCTIPAAFCHAHHFRQPWSQGGKTNLKDGKLLCPFHHHRTHHPHWDTHHHPDGTTTFTRRQ
jgi:Domain of unknown function (DUF222)